MSRGRGRRAPSESSPACTGGRGPHSSRSAETAAPGTDRRRSALASCFPYLHPHSTHVHVFCPHILRWIALIRIITAAPGTAVFAVLPVTELCPSRLLCDRVPRAGLYWGPVCNGVTGVDLCRGRSVPGEELYRGQHNEVGLPVALGGLSISKRHGRPLATGNRHQGYGPERRLRVQHCPRTDSREREDCCGSPAFASRLVKQTVPYSSTEATSRSDAWNDSHNETHWPASLSYPTKKNLPFYK
jgi:hypothetical protein